MDYKDKAKEIRESLSVLIGLRLARSVNWCATRNFYFGRADTQIEDALYTVSLDCPWRIQRDDVILVGSEDYSERAEDNTDESWEAGMPTGHLQNQKLAELFGELKGGSIVSTDAH